MGIDVCQQYSCLETPEKKVYFDEKEHLTTE